MRNVLFQFKQIFRRIKCIFTFVYLHVSRCELKFILFIGIFEEFILVGDVSLRLRLLKFQKLSEFLRIFKGDILIFPDFSKINE